jgi:hypothetical protein
MVCFLLPSEKVSNKFHGANNERDASNFFSGRSGWTYSRNFDGARVSRQVSG